MKLGALVTYLNSPDSTTLRHAVPVSHPIAPKLESEQPH